VALPKILYGVSFASLFTPSVNVPLLREKVIIRIEIHTEAGKAFNTYG
jgi:hypothetical protein